MEQENDKSTTIYFKTLTIENVKCFKGENSINLSQLDNKPVQWTILLGNNGTGKSTILRCIATLEAIQAPSKENEKNTIEHWPKGFFLLQFLTLRYQALQSFLANNRSYLISSELSIKYTIDKRMNNGNYEATASWGYGKNLPYPSSKIIGITRRQIIDTRVRGLIIYAYGINRRMSEPAFSESKSIDSNESLFKDEVYLLNMEEWFLQIDYAAKNGKPEALQTLSRIKQILLSGIFPDIRDFRFTTDEEFQSFVEYETDYGWVKLQDLGYGYQASLTWICDLAKRMFDRYPDAENPLAMPAIVLVDEIDLHLHPSWQRKIIGFLSNIFPNTQFIVTAHSPLIVQSAEDVNVVLLQKEGDHVTIHQPQFTTYKGWSVEEILTELMGMEDKTYSDAYLKLMQDFEAALDEDSYEKAKKAYDELDAILHPESSQRKLLRIQMASLTPAAQS